MMKRQYIKLTASLFAAALLPLAALGQTTGTQSRKPAEKNPAKPTAKTQQSQSISAEPFEIKGLTLGMSHDEFNQKLGGKCRSEGGCMLDQSEVPADYKYIAGFGAKSYYMSFLEGHLVRLQVISYADGFSSLAVGLREKFGRPTDESIEDVTTRGGANLQNSVMTWKRQGQSVSVQRFFGSIDSSSLLLVDDEFSLKEAEDLR